MDKRVNPGGIVGRMLSGLVHSAEEFLPALRQERRHLENAMKVDTAQARFFETIEDDTGDRWTVPLRLAAANKAFFTSERYRAQQSRADWQRTERAIQEFAARLVLYMRKKCMIPLYVHCAYRSPVEQHALARKGVSNAGKNWKTAMRAPHPQGCAVDIVHSSYHWDLTDQEWRFIGIIGKRIADRMGIEVVWGGDWGADWPRKRGWDPAHWELKGWRAQVDYDVPYVRDEDAAIHKTPSKILNEQTPQFVKGVSNRPPAVSPVSGRSARAAKADPLDLPLRTRAALRK